MMFIKILFSLMLSSIVGSTALGFEALVGIYKPDPKVQDRDGKEKSDPYSPFISIGHDFEFLSFPTFSPRLMYIRNQVNSDDHYSNDYKIETFAFLYDFLWKPQSWYETHIRYGFGSFNQKITGSGGTVSVPNGSSTSTAYKPDGESKSATGSLNLGIEYKTTTSGEYLTSYGVTAEIFYMSPLVQWGLSKNAYFAYSLGLVGWF